MPRAPGYLLADLLRRTGGRYETTMPLSPRLRDDIREVAELTSDADLRAIAELTEMPVGFEHLRGRDPQPALATVLPDGTVIAGDAFPHS